MTNLYRHSEHSTHDGFSPDSSIKFRSPEVIKRVIDAGLGIFLSQDELDLVKPSPAPDEETFTQSA